MKRGSNDPIDYPTVEKIAEIMGITEEILGSWLTTDREFVKKLTIVKETEENSPWRDKLGDKIRLDGAALAFGVVLVLEETKKRYTV